MLVLVCLAAWAVPGAGHLLAGPAAEGAGLPARAADDVRDRAAAARPALPVRAVASRWWRSPPFANAGLGLPWLLAAPLGAGNGIVTAVTYEYGNCFLIVVGPAELPGRPRRLRHRDGAQVTSHLLLLVVFAFLVSLVFAVLMRDEPRAQLRTGAMMFGGFVAAAIVLGWLMFPLPL